MFLQHDCLFYLELAPPPISILSLTLHALEPTKFMLSLPIFTMPNDDIFAAFLEHKNWKNAIGK